MSATPRGVIESQIAIDRTGFSTSRFTKWFDENYGATDVKSHWVKVHVVCGRRDARRDGGRNPSQGDSADSLQLPEDFRAVALLQNARWQLFLHDVKDFCISRGAACSLGNSPLLFIQQGRGTVEAMERAEVVLLGNQAVGFAAEVANRFGEFGGLSRGGIRHLASDGFRESRGALEREVPEASEAG
jgi:hypothetical protein